MIKADFHQDASCRAVLAGPTSARITGTDGRAVSGIGADGGVPRTGRILVASGRPVMRARVSAGHRSAAADNGAHHEQSEADDDCVACRMRDRCGTVHAAGSMDAPPCSAAHAADQGGIAAMPGTSVRSFSTAGCSGAVLQGERATATVNGDRIELRDGIVYVNGRSYGAVTPAQTVEYEAAHDRRTLKVDGKLRTPVR
ncbi:hypothetical protein [Burkholderia cepacia]|uniref:hypothetical protein n=1 Tax=Burkholderia cepacia TaxID=292 RepID=UPI003D677F77